VNIRFTSSLTPEDENIVAPAVLRALASILDLLPIAYNIRIETSDSHTYQHAGPTETSAIGSDARVQLLDRTHVV
jgi:hypothetical protein